ncbi:amidohydrolase family protein, partial [Dactylosporangium sp. NPDC051485]|uniref:amidohydrolase n=1 Tax=Dactylosporangium sp. NPDC051485 TaxID=3154846 RepID=UPI00343AA5CC
LDAVPPPAPAQPAGAVVNAHGWHESAWADPATPSAAELDRAGGGRAVYLSRTCVHAALVSTALLSAEAKAAPGYDDGGWLRRDAHHVVREAAYASVTAAQVHAAQRAALRHAAALGIACVHECGGPGTSGEADFTAALGHGPDHPLVIGLWGETGAAAKARELGAAGAAGDLYADGALGARTAHLGAAYRDEPGSCGHGYLTAQQVTDHLVGCVRHGVQGGFHAIGDQAIGTVLAGFAGAAAIVGVDAVRDGRHRVEHAELLDKAAIARFVEFGVVASVQPAFDRLWGGEHGMYATRLGPARALAANPLAALAGVGVTLAFGSDSPVTPLDPWGSCRAAMRHHNPAQRIGGKAAFAAHTRGGWRAARLDDEGVLDPGGTATFTVWDTTGPVAAVLSGERSPAARRTVLRGRTIHTTT